ncbi:hypothetical protein ACFX2K_022479 [Malus domestica]
MHTDSLDELLKSRLGQQLGKEIDHVVLGTDLLDFNVLMLLLLVRTKELRRYALGVVSLMYPFFNCLIHATWSSKIVVGMSITKVRPVVLQICSRLLSTKSTHMILRARQESQHGSKKPQLTFAW